MFVLLDNIGTDNGPAGDNADSEEGSYRAGTEDEESRHDAE